MQTDVLDWWFGPQATTVDELKVKAGRWFRDGAKLDGEVRDRFGAIVEQAVQGGLQPWETTTEGRVALIIVLDQLTRHVYRDEARMYAGDARAQALSFALFESGEGRTLRSDWRHFAMMPMLHAEDLILQRRSVEEMDALVKDAAPLHRQFLMMGIEQSRKYLDVVTRFGRFPHRNAILGRTSTTEELEFMKTFVGPPTDTTKKFS